MKDITLRLLAAAAVLLLIALCAFALLPPAEAMTWLSTAALGAGFLLKDKRLRTIHALPNGAATTNGAGLDLGTTARSDFVAMVEAVVAAPVLTVGELANAETVTYHLYHDTDPAFGTEALLVTLGTQTGAGGVGAAAAEYRTKLASNVKRYLRLKTVKVGAVGNASTKNGQLELAF